MKRAFTCNEGQTMKVIANVLNAWDTDLFLHTWTKIDRYLIVSTFKWEREGENGWMARHRSLTKLLLNYNSKSCNRFFVGHKDCLQNPYRYIIYHFALSPSLRSIRVFFVLLYLMMFAYVLRNVKSECIKELLFTLSWCIDPSAHKWMSESEYILQA